MDIDRLPTALQVAFRYADQLNAAQSTVSETVVNRFEEGKTAAEASKSQVKSWMRKNVKDYEDRKTGEINTTQLAEAAAGEFDKNGLGDWLDDETHWVWDVALEVASAYEKQHKTAGYGYGVSGLSVLFIEGRKPVPFNRDTLDEINHLSIPVVADDGENHEATLRVSGWQSSGPLTFGQEKLGWRREVRVDIQFPVDEGGNPDSSARTAMAALAKLGKKLGFKVEPAKPGYRPETRK